MSQLGRKAGPETPGPARGPPGPGTFDNVAGFRIGRGRDNNGAPHARPQQPPYGQQTPPGPSYGSPQAPQPYPPQQPPYGRGGHSGGGNGGGGWPQVNRGPGGPGGPGGYGGQHRPGPGGGHGEPEYFGDGGAYPPGPHGHHAPHDPYAANNPGHTQAFRISDDHYHDDAAPLPGPVGPRLPWKDLLKGIVTAPDQTFLRMRDYTAWGPALTVTFLYGLLAVFSATAPATDRGRAARPAASGTMWRRIRAHRHSGRRCAPSSPRVPSQEPHLASYPDDKSHITGSRRRPRGGTPHPAHPSLGAPPYAPTPALRTRFHP
ncbi:hypothetical protein SHIRM173S_07708 [Streptomyces hirsutus]